MSLMALLCWVGTFAPTTAITACDCDRSLKTEMYSLFRSESCQRDEEPDREERVAAFVEKGDSVEITGFRCSGLITKTSFLCDTLSYNYITRPTVTSPLRMTVQDCIMAATRGVWNIQVGDRATGFKVSVGASTDFRASNTGDFPNEKTGSCTHRTNYEMHSGTVEIERIGMRAFPDMSQVVADGKIMAYSKDMGVEGTSEGTYV